MMHGESWLWSTLSPYRSKRGNLESGSAIDLRVASVWLGMVFGSRAILRSAVGPPGTSSNLSPAHFSQVFRLRLAYSQAGTCAVENLRGSDGTSNAQPQPAPAAWALRLAAVLQMRCSGLTNSSKVFLPNMAVKVEC